MASLAETNGTAVVMRRRIARLFAPLLGLSLLGAAAGLYVHDTELYYKALTWLGIDPFRHPFVDGEYILAAIKCWRQGTDVFIANSCDVLARPFAYSPLWLRLPPVPMSWATPIGLATNRDLGDRRMSEKGCFEFEARYILPTASQIVLLSIDEIEPSVLVDHSNIASMEP